MMLVAALVTFCWAQDLGSARTCVYSEQSCREVQLLRGGVCAPVSDTRFWRRRAATDSADPGN